MATRLGQEGNFADPERKLRELRRMLRELQEAIRDTEAMLQRMERRR